MKLRKLLDELNLIKKNYGDDIEVVMSSDPEGNSYSTLEEQSISFVYEKEDDFVNAEVRGYLSENAQDVIDNFYKHSKVIGICLYPWNENIDSAERACNWEKIEAERKLNRKIAQAENRLDAAKETGELL